jgi:hypothetical protein
VDQHCLCGPIAFQVPASIPVTKGNAGTGDTFLTFRKAGVLQKCIFHGNQTFGKSGKSAGGDAYQLVNCTDGSKAGGAETADWFSLEVHGGDQSQGPTVVSLRLGAPDVVNGIVQEQIVYATDGRIPGAALHIPRGSAPANQEFSLSVLPQPAVGSTIANGDDPFMTTGYAVDVHATGVDQFVFTGVSGSTCPRIDLPYSPAALAALGGDGAVSRLRAHQIIDLAGLTGGSSVLAPTSDVTIDPVNNVLSFCVSHLSYYVTGAHMLDDALVVATLTSSPPQSCTTAADCNPGESCNGDCYVDLLAAAAPPLLPNSHFVLHLEFQNKTTATWTSSIVLRSVKPGFPPVELTPSPWAANVPQNLGSAVDGGANASFDVDVTSPSTEDAAAPAYGDLLNLCLMNVEAPFGECFSWDPPNPPSGTPEGYTAAVLVDVCGDGIDNDGDGYVDDPMGSATAVGQTCNNGQTGSCYSSGFYECDGLRKTKCGAASVTPNGCGGCTTLLQKPNTTCDTGQVGQCAPTGIMQCNGPDAEICVAQAAPTTCVGTDKCQQTYMCEAGACVGSNPVICTTTDPNATGATCDPSTGNCIADCNSGYTFCGALCTNMNTDPNNCGSCGNVCSPAQACQRFSPGTCVDVSWANWPMPNDPVDVAAGAPNPMAYTDNGDGTVTDTVTGLMWQQAVAPGTFTQPQAVAFCPTLNLGNHNDWRLPTIIELSSLVDLGRRRPSINVTYFPAPYVGPFNFWSATPMAGSPSFAWLVGFSDGSATSAFQGAAYSFNVRCVR